jgi:DNA-binding NtrC family response regulator
MAESGAPAPEVIGSSEEAGAIRRFIREAAGSSEPVTLLGEPGTGKQLVAIEIHNASPRRKAPFLMIDCSLYYERELKRELFGYGGAGPTGKDCRKGMLEFASRGTCYLSHIEEITPSLQAAIARFVAAGSFPRLGDGKEVSSSVRLIVSSDKNLDGLVSAGLFDAELYLALSKWKKVLRPLRERPEDIPLIVDWLRSTFAGRTDGSPAAFLPEAMRALQAYPWPSNFDEIKKEVHRLLQSGCRRVGPEHLAMEISSFWLGQGGDPQVRRVLEELDGYIREFRIMSQLECEVGDLLEMLVGGEEAMNPCSRGLWEGF